MQSGFIRQEHMTRQSLKIPRETADVQQDIGGIWFFNLLIYLKSYIVLFLSSLPLSISRFSILLL